MYTTYSVSVVYYLEEYLECCRRRSCVGVDGDGRVVGDVWSARGVCVRTVGRYSDVWFINKTFMWYILRVVLARVHVPTGARDGWMDESPVATLERCDARARRESDGRR